MKEIEREHGQQKEGVSKMEECLIQEKRARKDGNKKAHEKLLKKSTEKERNGREEMEKDPEIEKEWNTTKESEK
jgi:hypothetical protein